MRSAGKFITRSSEKSRELKVFKLYRYFEDTLAGNGYSKEEEGGEEEKKEKMKTRVDERRESFRVRVESKLEKNSQR